MKTWKIVSVTAVLVALIHVAPAKAQQRSLTLSNVHVCCPGCVKIINEAIGKVENISVDVNKDEKTVTVAVKEGGTRQDAIAALEGLAAAGFYGESNRQRIKMKDESEGLSGSVTNLTLTGIHNCCGQCDKAIKAVVAKVDGTQVPEIGKKAREFSVTGNFDSATLIKEFNKAGFYVKVKKDGQ